MAIGALAVIIDRTLPDRYLLPHIDDSTADLARTRTNIKSKIDLAKAYHKIPMELKGILKTAIALLWGCFEYTRTPFGLRNAAQTFQRFINNVTRGLPFVYAYIDDFPVASRTPHEHECHLRLILKRLVEYGLLVNVKKCIFGVPEQKCLGNVITPVRIRTLTFKFQVLHDFPCTKKIYMAIWGLINFHRTFIPQCTDLSGPLKMLLSATAPLRWK